MIPKIAHPFCNMCPVLTPLEKSSLEDHIRRNGLLESGKYYQGFILDGCHRAEACAKVGVEMRWEEFIGTEQEALEYVVGKNLHHRSWLQRDRSYLLMEVMALYESKKWIVKSEVPENQSVDNPSREGNTQESIAKTTGFSVATVERAAKVQKSGVPALKKMVSKGEVGFKAAATIASKPKAEQKTIVAKGPEAVQEAARDHSNAYNNLPAPSRLAPLRQQPGLAPGSTMTVANNGAVNPMAAALGNTEAALKRAKLQADWAEIFVKKMEACYQENAEDWKQSPPPSARRVVDTLIKAVRA